MDESQVRDEGGVLDVEVVFRDLFGGELPFVGDGLGGEGVDVEAAFGSEHGGRFFFGHFADAEKFSFEVAEGEFLCSGVGDEDLSGIGLQVNVLGLRI